MTADGTVEKVVEPTLVMSWTMMATLMIGIGTHSPTMMPTGNGMTMPASMNKASMMTPPTTRLVTGKLNRPFLMMALRRPSMWPHGMMPMQPTWMQGKGSMT